MKPPFIQGALRGWTSPLTVNVITKTTVDHQVVETPATITADMNYQPMPPTKVDRKPIEQRTWKWWTLILKDSTLLWKTDDMVTVEDHTFRIVSAQDLRTSGASIYEAIEDYTS